MLPHTIIMATHRVTLEVYITAQVFRTTCSGWNHLLLLHQRSYLIETVDIIFSNIRLHNLDRILLCQSIGATEIPFRNFPVILSSDTITHHFHWVDGGLQHRHIFGSRCIAHNTSIRHIKVWVKLNNRMFFPEFFPTIRYILRFHTLWSQVFK